MEGLDMSRTFQEIQPQRENFKVNDRLSSNRNNCHIHNRFLGF